jgi:hypothetical protein
MQTFENPFRPGAGHPPPYLAGRNTERSEFEELLEQSPVMSNLVLTGLRGVGKTVLLETLKPLALHRRWQWAGTDLSEAASVSEESLAVRILADLAPLVSNLVVDKVEVARIGFAHHSRAEPVHLDYALLKAMFDHTPGLVADKLKAVFRLVWLHLAETDVRGVVLAYDEAQNLSDQAGDKQHPLSLLLDVFQWLQRSGMPFLLVLTGLPTLFPKLVEARTFAERMFHVAVLEQLDEEESRQAILRPIDERRCPVKFASDAVAEIIEHSGGYPYFIQFFCRDLFDSYLQQQAQGNTKPQVSIEQTVQRLDSDFFAGRWSRVTDRQRELLTVVAQLPNCDDEFTVQEIVMLSKQHLTKSFSPSHVNQMLAKLGDNGLVYKNRHGRYSFAVPLLGGFIRRQQSRAT